MLTESSAESHSRARRVLFPFVGDTAGGSHIAALELAGGLDPTRFEAIVAVHRDGMLWSYLESRGMNALKVPDLRPTPLSGSLRQDGPAMVLATPRLVRLLRLFRVDIVHTNDARMHFLFGVPPPSWPAPSSCCTDTPSSSRASISPPDSRIPYSPSPKTAVTSFRPGQRPESMFVLNPFRPPCSREDPGAWRHRLLNEAGGPSRATVIVGYVANLVPQKRPLMFVENSRTVARPYRREVVLSDVRRHRSRA